MEIAVQRQQGKFYLDVDFTCSDTGITALCGPSGSGKTTLINMVAGLSKPDRGRISIQNRLLFDSDQGVNLPPEKRQLGYVFQDGRLFRHYSVKSNLNYGLKLVPREHRFIHLENVVEILGIGHLLSRRPHSLSGGEKQRVALGRALLSCPRFLLMDEPLASLGQDHRQEIIPYIKRLNLELKIPMLYVSHDSQEIAALADRVIRIQEGRLLAD